MRASTSVPTDNDITDEKWQLSEHALFYLRAPLETFAEAHKARDLRWAYATYKLFQERLEVYNELFQHNKYAENPSYFIFIAVCRLMQVVLPWEKQTQSHNFSVNYPALPNRWFPSAAALAAGCPFRFPPLSEHGRDDYSWGSGGDLISPLCATSPASMGRKDLVDKAIALFKQYRHLVPTTRPLINNLLNALKATERDVNAHWDDSEEYTGWLDWHFVFPDYQTKRMIVKKDPASNVMALEPTDLLHDRDEYFASPLGSPVPGVHSGHEVIRRKNELPPRQLVQPEVQAPAIVSSSAAASASASTSQHQAKRATVSSRRQKRHRGQQDEPKRSAPSRHWTFGEVADHASEADRWALVSNGQSGFDVYDVTGT